MVENKHKTEAAASIVERDEVDEILSAWEAQRPDFDVQPLAVFSRMLRLGRYIGQIRRKVFTAHHLESWEFEMLAALRRAGEPFCLTAGQLMAETLVTSGTITNRIDRMQDHGYVERLRRDGDKRVVDVRATEAGIAAVDAAMQELLDVQRGLLADVSAAEVESAEQFLKVVLAASTRS